MSQVPQGQQAASGRLGMPAGFFASLFDMEFHSFITTKVIKFLYWLAVILYTLGALALFVSLATRGAIWIIVGIIVAPIYWLVTIIVARIALEVVMVIFRASDDVRAIRQVGYSGTAGSGGVAGAYSQPSQGYSQPYPQPGYSQPTDYGQPQPPEFGQPQPPDYGQGYQPPEP
jgi:hypothetical protein